MMHCPSGGIGLKISTENPRAVVSADPMSAPPVVRMMVSIASAIGLAPWASFEPELRRRTSKLDAQKSMTEWTGSMLLECLPSGESTLLGFDEPSSFFQASHEWSGETPELVRMAAR
jgi:hypothetical protein